MNRTRRSFVLAAGASVTLAGCTSDSDGGDGDSGADTTQDSDGDGVPDRSDYAPRDPDVQSENDVSDGSGGGGSDGSDGSDDEATDSGGSDTGGGTTVRADDVSYPSYSGSHTITARDNYWAWEFSVPRRFVLEYTVQNIRDENYDFDVLLYDPERFREYRAIATEQRDGIRPQYIDGSAPGVESGARGSVELPAGTYYLVIDNTDLSDAGDWGTEDTRQVRLRAETRAP